MARFLIVFILSLFSFSSFACLVFINDSNGDRAHSSIKHYNPIYDKTHILVLENANKDEACEFVISPVEMIQNTDGRYRFIKSKPGMKLKRSVVPYMEVRDQNGNNVLGEVSYISPGQRVTYGIQFNVPKELQSGSYHGGVQFDFIDNIASFLLSEINLNYGDDQAKLQLDRISYNQETKKLEFKLINIGGGYTFFKIGLIFTDPITGFERSFYTDTQDNRIGYFAHIRNHALPSGQRISAKYSIKTYLRILKKEFSDTFPGQQFPKQLNITMLPVYGIDHASWKNHYYKKLRFKSIKIPTL